MWSVGDPRSRGTLLQDSPQAHPCGLGRDIHEYYANLKEVAPAHPCARDIPFILNITVLMQGTAHPRLCA